ncbi:MAG: hypothetical protein J6334_11770, partial [Kiritimatiellae bacterium]|nr:hypothetical protein [Kiritimatiellia bacterium]
MHKTRRRFQGYDYARGGALFVTTCLEPRRPLFGSVDHERVALSEAGEIGNNPLKWWLMHGDRSLMHVMEPFPLSEAGDSDLWRAVGNDALLESPRIVSLRISRKVSESALQQVVAVCRR